MDERSTIFNITVLTDLKTETGRTNLEGIFAFANRQNWSLRILNSPSELSPDVVHSLETGGNSGLILADSIPDHETINAFKDTHFPIVTIGLRSTSLVHRPDAAVIAVDEHAVGRIGANYLLSLGNFASFAFVNQLTSFSWPVTRAQGFTEVCRRHGHEVTVFTVDQGEDLSRLSDWLNALPKPTAIMTSWDNCAMKVISACREARINIPNDLVLIGVDDDRLLCENARPRLTSIRIDNRYDGYWAASALKRLLHGKTVPHAVSKICGVIERESTRHISPSQRILRAGLAYIEAHAHEGIGVDDVVNHLGISRSLANTRFREAGDVSIGEAIIQAKLLLVRRMLKTHDWPINRIARNCGFSNPNRLSHLFAERFGQSMSSYRTAGKSYGACLTPRPSPRDILAP